MTLKDAKTQWATRQKKYLVGYIASSNTLYGGGPINLYTCVDPLTRAQAAKRLSEMPCSGCAVFELVPVQINK